MAKTVASLVLALAALVLLAAFNRKLSRFEDVAEGLRREHSASEVRLYAAITRTSRELADTNYEEIVGQVATLLENHLAQTRTEVSCQVARTLAESLDPQTERASGDTPATLKPRD